MALEQSQITDVDFPYCVRLRRGMYISDRNQMVTEIVDNSVDEHCEGRCDVISIWIIDTYIIIEDNGNGIPCTLMPGKNKTQVEEAFTKLHSGGKFGTNNGYKNETGGMHGVGGSCVQALSKEMSIEIVYDGKKYLTNFAKGFITEHTRVIEDNIDVNKHGTKIIFKIDEEVMKDSVPLNFVKLKQRVKQLAYLNPGLKINYCVDREDIKEKESFIYKDGLKEYINELVKNKNKITDTLFLKTIKDNININIALVYTDSYNTTIFTFCNNMATTDNGDHLNGFYTGLNSAIGRYIKENNIELNYKKEDIREGLTAIIAIKVKNPIFIGQSKTKLFMNSVKKAVAKSTEDLIYEYLDKNPDTAKGIIAKIEIAAKARIAVLKAKETARKSKGVVLGGAPSKLAECTSKNPAECEIWIVEGDSAGGSAKQARNRYFQAILPVFGKVANVEKKRYVDVLNNEKLNMLVRSAKCGIGEDFDLSKNKYEKHIISTDADIDGFHIRTLWITYYYRYLRPIIENGMLYIACPPLFKIIKGKKYVYAYSDEERDQIIKEQFNDKVDNVQRYKGLGEMDPEQLWETTMNPETRRLIQVTIEDAEACEAAISLCMSEDSAARCEWIEENSYKISIN